MRTAKRFKGHFIAGGTAVLISAVFVVVVMLWPPPVESTLKPFSGTVVSESHVRVAKSTGYSRVVLDTHEPGDFLSIGYTRPFDRACARVAPGASISAIALRSPVDEARWLVWGLSVNGTPCVPYEDVARETHAQGRISLWLGAASFACGLLFIARGVHVRRKTR